MERFTEHIQRRAVTLIAACTALGIVAASANATTFVQWTANGGTGGAWETDANWDTGIVPSNAVSADNVNVYIHQNTSSAAPVTVTSNVDLVQKVFVGEDSSGNPGAGHITVDGGTLPIAADFEIASRVGSTGVVNIINGGVIDMGSNRPTIIGRNGTGELNIIDGTYSIGSEDVLIGDGSGNGTFHVRGNSDVDMNQRFFLGGGSGHGTLVLDGSVGTGDDILNTRGGTNRLRFLNNSTLRAIIDQDAVNNPDDMRQFILNSTQNTSSNALFEPGSLLDPSFGPGVTPVTGSWTLVSTAAGLTDNGLAFAPGVDAGWSFSTDGGQLTVSYVVPEPTSASAMLVLGGMLTVMRRRR